jgi:hypothetical protein
LWSLSEAIAAYRRCGEEPFWAIFKSCVRISETEKFGHGGMAEDLSKAAARRAYSEELALPG